jgi:hypothetical protein
MKWLVNWWRARRARRRWGVPTNGPKMPQSMYLWLDDVDHNKPGTPSVWHDWD